VAAVAAASAAAPVYVNFNDVKSPDYVNESVINSLAQNKKQAEVDGKSDATNINNHHYLPMNANASLHTTPR
jgi:fumarylacetoacetate (FAA) hydrolase family protein